VRKWRTLRDRFIDLRTFSRLGCSDRLSDRLNRGHKRGRLWLCDGSNLSDRFFKRCFRCGLFRCDYWFSNGWCDFDLGLDFHFYFYFNFNFFFGRFFICQRRSLAFCFRFLYFHELLALSPLPFEDVVTFLAHDDIVHDPAGLVHRNDAAALLAARSIKLGPVPSGREEKLACRLPMRDDLDLRTAFAGSTATLGHGLRDSRKMNNSHRQSLVRHYPRRGIARGLYLYIEGRQNRWRA